MKICITVGHSILKNGCCTSADGRKVGGCLEYKWCKSFGKKLKKELDKRGHEVDLIICPEGVLEKSNDERDYKVPRVNAKNYDLLMELHLNAFDNPQANGACVLYKTNAGYRYAEPIQRRLATIFRDRGSVQRNDLYILNQTKPPAILLETFFCTCVSDFLKAKGDKNKKKIAALVADGIEDGWKNKG